MSLELLVSRQFAALPLAAMVASVVLVPSPNVTSFRRPVPAADSIYALAVDSNAYREYPFVYLLDDGVARLEPDGRGTRTYHQVIQILKPSGVAQWAEQRIAYQPDRENVTVNWMRVVRPSGEVISDKPSQSQTSDVAAATVDPVYTQTKVIRYSLSNVTAGTLVDLSWTIETTKPPMPGDLQVNWSVTLATPGMRSRFVLDVPTGYAPHIVERHLDFARTEVEAGGRHVYTWATQNVTPVRGEIFAPDSSLPVMTLRIGAPLKWTDIGHWYSGLSKDRYVLTPALTKAVDSVVRGAKTNADTLNALHKWIAKDLRYVSISLGIGGYQPRFPEATIATGYGDCKDKATLFIAAAHHVGITAYPVLLSSYGVADSTFPAIEQFNHVIAAVERRGTKALTYLDLTTFAFPLNEVPPSYQGGFGLMVLPDGSSRDVVFPKDSIGASEQLFVGEMNTDGRVSGTLSFRQDGVGAVNLRARYSEPLDSAQRAGMKRSAPRPFAGATIDTVIMFDPNDPNAPAVIDIVFHDGEGAKPAGSMMILSLPGAFRSLATPYRSVVDELQHADARRLPIDVAKVAGDGTSRTELRMQLPVGWTAQLPPAVHTSGPFGSYDAEYSQVGRELRVVHSLTGATGAQPADRIGTLVDWLQKMLKDDAEYVPIVRGS
jgi:transglutaminase-like putative cysteine protease